jgi:flagellar basal body-associated protein FliL
LLFPQKKNKNIRKTLLAVAAVQLLIVSVVVLAWWCWHGGAGVVVLAWWC